MLRSLRTPVRRPLFLAALVLISNIFASLAVAIEDVDRILTIVNDDIITQTELNVRLRQTKKQLLSQKIKIPADKLLRKQLLERLILDRIQTQIAQSRGIRISESDIDKQIDFIAKQNKMAREVLLDEIKKDGIDLLSYRYRVRDMVLIQQLTERMVNRRIRVSESEVDFFLESRSKLLGANDSYDLSHIMIPVPEEASADNISKTRQLAEKILAILIEGADFEATAIAYSKGKEALEGGNLGWRSAGQLPDLFVRELETLEAGQFSGILQSANGFHILKLNERRSSKKRKNVTQTLARHILMKPTAIQDNNATRRKITELYERLLSGDDFAAIAKAHSEDVVSAANGGNLGWINPGQTVAAFEKALSALKPMELSKPTKSRFGWHIIQVLERRQKDIGQELDRAEARKQIHSRKAEERYQQWIRQMRDEAYVRHMNTDDSTLNTSAS